MNHIGYKSCLANPDLWLRPIKLDDGIEFYELILLYLNDCLVISEPPDVALANLRK